jgi:hypothetical protein
MANYPIVYDPFPYLTGMNLSFNTTALIDVAAGQCLDSTKVNFIVISDTVTINTALTGAGGLDQGTIANSTLYNVFAIGDSTLNNAGSALISTASSPLMPHGYDMFKLIGHVKTDGSALILAFGQTGNGSTRRMTYDTLIQVLNAGNATTFTNVDCSASVPSTAKAVVLQCAFTPATAGTNQLKLRRDGSASTNGSVQANGTVNAVVAQSQLFVPVAAGIFEYLVTNGSDAATINLSAYDDEL